LLKEIDKKIVRAVLLEVSADFDIIDYYLLLKKRMCYGFSTSAISWIQSYLIELKLLSLVEASLMSNM
jgi:hypothetical protein